IFSHWSRRILLWGTGRLARKVGARRGLRHDDRAGERRGETKGIERAVEEAAGDERAFMATQSFLLAPFRAQTAGEVTGPLTRPEKSDVRVYGSSHQCS